MPKYASTTLWNELQRFIKKRLVEAPHQRGKRWDEPRYHAWARTIRNAAKTGGSLQLYQVTDDPTVYVNDGMNRLRATLAIWEDPSAYGFESQAAVQTCLQQFMIGTIESDYADHVEALIGFQEANIGTPLDGHDFAFGLLRYADRYDSLYQEQLEILWKATELAARPIASRRRKSDDSQTRKQKRHNYALLGRWLSKRKDTGDFSDLGDGTTIKAITETRPQMVCEYRLAELLKGYTAAELRTEIVSLINCIDDTSNRIRDALDHVLGAKRTASPTVYRWLWEVGVWLRLNNFSLVGFDSFIELVIGQGSYGKKGQASPKIAALDNSQQLTLGLGKLATLPLVCKLIESDFYLGRETRKSGSSALLPGYDESHLKPFHTHGNGPTVPERASDNRARGARPMDLGDADAAGS